MKPGKRHLSSTLSVLLVALFACVFAIAQQPPPAPKRPVQNIHHSVTVVDDYRCLENFADAEVKQWVTAENTYTRSVLDKIPGRTLLAHEVDATIKKLPTNYGGLRVVRDKVFAFKSEPTREQPELVVFSSLTGNSAETVVLDPLKLDAKGHVKWISTTRRSMPGTWPAAIADVVRRVENPPAWSEESHLNATVATSIISHGVDVERFNLMIMDSIPEETADYIQASSRSGRRHVGLILATLASYSLRASSIYNRFTEYHRHLERLVSPVSVNRFARLAAERTSSGVFAGVVLGRYGAIIHNQQLAKRRVAAEFLNPSTASHGLLSCHR